MCLFDIFGVDCKIARSLIFFIKVPIHAPPPLNAVVSFYLEKRWCHSDNRKNRDS